ncbi:MAG: DUF58 domain-containing protein [Pirellulaceae bacterium]|jgi:uncharacterized protein (DUF58 family)|nr:DUF58 domain-containing protein [Pirellulaceae bacterium]MCU0978098.1 DUF58 domain-containing protein [Pirellulaceae bacterium]
MGTRHRTSLCREGWYVLLLLAVVLTWALVRENNLLLLVSGVIGGMLLIDWRMSAAALRRLEVRRRIVSGSHAGSWITVEVEVLNKHRRLASWAVAVEDRVARRTDLSARQPLRPRVLFPWIPIGQRVRQSYRVCLPQRGRYGLGPLRIATRFPFGLVQRIVWLDGDDELVVLPRLGQLRPAWLRHCPPAPHGVHGARRPGYVPGDFFAIREWQSGDSVRWVHWRSTARHRELVVRQFEQPGERQVAVLLDLWAPEQPRADHARRIEWAVSFAATLVADSSRRRSPALLAIAAAQPVCLAGLASRPFARQAFVALALAEPCAAAPLSSLRDEALGRLGPEVELIVISTREDAVAELPTPAAAVRPNLGRRPPCRLIVVDEAGAALREFFQWDQRAAEAKP